MAHYVISYDVGTGTPAGRRRLRRIARLCTGFGQRVQLSVFECTLDEMQIDRLMAQAGSIIDPAHDSLRAYRLHGERAGAVAVLGQDRYVDFDAPLIR